VLKRHKTAKKTGAPEEGAAGRILLLDDPNGVGDGGLAVPCRWVPPGPLLPPPERAWKDEGSLRRSLSKDELSRGRGRLCPAPLGGERGVRNKPPVATAILVFGFMGAQFFGILAFGSNLGIQ